MPSPPNNYVEIFQSKPSWRNAYILVKDESSADGWSDPRARPLVDAAHVRAAFRVHRTTLERDAAPLRFVVTNGSKHGRDWDAPTDAAAGGCYVVSAPGRYVVESGRIRRVGDADAAECRRAASADRWVQVRFAAELWEKCFFAYRADGADEWVPAPGVEMELVSSVPRVFEVAVAARRVEFAFNDGGGEAGVWDSNRGKNFLCPLPGMYEVTEGEVRNLGRADKDEEEEAASRTQAKVDGGGIAAAVRV
jgi:Carbohydrate binding domain (family 25)